MQATDRNNLCKLQNKPGNEYVYIVYGTKPFKPSNQREYVTDYAGIFETKTDAKQVAKCLNKIFTQLQNDKWIFTEKYTTRRANIYSEQSSNNANKYIVQGGFFSKMPLDLSTRYKEWILRITSTKQDAEKIVENFQNTSEYTYKYKKYRINDILPTMYLDDYTILEHQKHFKHVMDELGNIPRAQKTRRDLRRGARENKNILYSDSSDSEDESKYKKVTKRSLLHTPRKK